MDTENVGTCEECGKPIRWDEDYHEVGGPGCPDGAELVFCDECWEQEPPAKGTGG